MTIEHRQYGDPCPCGRAEVTEREAQFLELMDDWYGDKNYRQHPEWLEILRSTADADMSADLIDAAVANGAKGIVIAGVGNGNMPKACVTAAANAVKKGVVVVRSSRVVTGNVGRNVELNDDDLGFIASDELNPQKSRIQLMLALLKPRAAKDMQVLFQTY